MLESSSSLSGQSTSSPRTSIIIPAYDEARFLPRLLRQFPPDLRRQLQVELIVSDGGSSDETVAIARSHADHVVEWKGSAPQNISIGRNMGAACASGDVLIFLNADVHVDDPKRFVAEMQRAVVGEGIVAATCNVRVNPEEEIFADRVFHRAFNWYCRFLNVTGMGMGRGECQVVRKTLFDQAGGYNESIPAGEDFEFFMRLRRSGKISFVPTCTVFESPRRYRSYGYLRIALLWFANGLSVVLFHRSLSKQWTPVR